MQVESPGDLGDEVVVEADRLSGHEINRPERRRIVDHTGDDGSAAEIGTDLIGTASGRNRPPSSNCPVAEIPPGRAKRSARNAGITRNILSD